MTFCRLSPLAAVVLLLLPTSTVAFSNPVESLINDVFSKSKGAAPPVTSVRGDELLKELDIQSNTEPRPFSAELTQIPALLTASMPLVFRVATGVFCNGYQASIIPRQDYKYTILPLFDKYQVYEQSTIRPRLEQREPLVLYDIEACPYCLKVREAVSLLSLETTFRPCPKEGYTWRRQVKEKYGHDATFPLLKDPNTQAQMMMESDDIINYLFSTYGNGKIPSTLAPDNSLVNASAIAGLLFRGTSGRICKPSNPPTLPLKLWSYEGSPFCKLVKEKLCELQIEHTQISCPQGSANRQIMFEEKGRFQVPYLEDPNTGVSLFESTAICEYLEKQYAIAPSPVKYI